MGRGTLRIYLGAAPGVGQDRGHARRGATAASSAAPTSSSASSRRTAGPTPRDMLDGLEVVPPPHGGAPRQPASPSSTSTPSSPAAPRSPSSTSSRTPTPPARRATKRWQDVEELLDAGIDVISTVNIQHLESLNDVVEAITGVASSETVPDEVVRRADQIELVDMSPEALRRRMAHGNIYRADQVDAALANYFRRRQPLRPARAGAALAGRPGRRGPRAVPRRPRHHATRGRPGSASSSPSPAAPRARRCCAGAPRSPRAVPAASCSPATSPGRRARRCRPGNPRRACASWRPSSAATFHERRRATTSPRRSSTVARGVNATQIVIGASRRSRLAAAPRPASASARSPTAPATSTSTSSATRAVAGRRPRARRHGLPSSSRAAAAGCCRRRRPRRARPPARRDRGTARPAARGAAVPLAHRGRPRSSAACWPALARAPSSRRWSSTGSSPTPLGTLTIPSPQNALALVVFVVVAVAVASVVQRRRPRAARRAAAAARVAGPRRARPSPCSAEADPLPALLRAAPRRSSVCGAAVVSRAQRCATRGPSWPPTGASTLERHRRRGRRRSTHGRRRASHLLLVGPVAARRRTSASSAPSPRTPRPCSPANELVEPGPPRPRRWPGTTAPGRRCSRRSRTTCAPRWPASRRRSPACARPSVTFSPEDEADAARDDRGVRRPARPPWSATCSTCRGCRRGSVDPRRTRSTCSMAASSTLPARHCPSGDRVRLDLDADLPLVRADAGLLDRVLANVLENALRHSPATRRSVVHAGAARRPGPAPGRRPGPGVPDEAKDLIFAPFQRVGDAPQGDGRRASGWPSPAGSMEAMGGTLVGRGHPRRRPHHRHRAARSSPAAVQARSQEDAP